MSIPTPPPERQSAYPHQTPPRRPPRPPPPRTGAHGRLPGRAAARSGPARRRVQPVPARARPAPADPSVDAGRFWAGVVATALVAALVGLVGV